MSALATRVLDACLRRVRTAEWASSDLVLLRAHPVLVGLPAVADLVGEPWRIVEVGGELTLRDALPEAGRLVAVVPASFGPPPDIAGRSWLHRPLELRADDIVSGITGRSCEPLADEELAAAVMESVELLATQVGRWSQHGTVTTAEVRAVLVAADIGADQRLDRERDHELLTRWILRGAPRSRVPALLARALQESIPRTGRYLAWAARTGDVPGLLAAGALSGDAESPCAVEPPPRTQIDRQELRAFVDRAVRDAWRIDSQRAAAALQTAERLAHRSRAVEEDPGRFPLLRAALDRALFRFAREAAAGRPVDDAAVDGLRANLYGAVAGEAIAQVQDLGRIARALALRGPEATVDDWARFAVESVGWLDLAIRCVRRRRESLPADLQGPSDALLGAALRRRDQWNQAFAARLAVEWPAAAARKDLRQPLALHQLSRALLMRLVEDGQRVLLVVLDGCDLSSFLEIAGSLPEGLGLALPAVADGALRQDLGAAGALRVALAPVPTVTSHARRALFAGEISGNTALNETEAPVANASADATAFSRSPAWKDTPRQLLLKGQLGEGALIEALSRPDLRLVAVVWNGVDDALSSKETTALGPWSVGALGVDAAAALKRAVDLGWTVVVTADHGHTPYLEASRKVGPAALGARYHTEPLPGAVRFEAGPLPARPLHLLVEVGAWAGGQRRGFHGGAGIEEVIVPLAFIGPGAGRPRPPAWWWSAEGAEPLPEPAVELPHQPPPPVPPPIPAASRPSVVPAPVLEALAARPEHLAAIQHLAERELLSLTQLSSLIGRLPFFVGGLMGTIQADLARAGVAVPFVEEEAGTERRYRWRRT